MRLVPHPRNDGPLEALGDATIFFSLDGSESCCLVDISKGNKEKIAFLLHYALLQLNPFVAS